MISQIPTEIFGIKFTNTQRDILEHLSNGRGYTLEELKIYDKFATNHVIQMHLHNIRKKIVSSKYRIHSGHENGVLTFRLVKILES